MLKNKEPYKYLKFFYKKYYVNISVLQHCDQIYLNKVSITNSIRIKSVLAVPELLQKYFQCKKRPAWQSTAETVHQSSTEETEKRKENHSSLQLTTARMKSLRNVVSKN